MNNDGTTTCPVCKTKQPTKMKRLGPPKLHTCAECGVRYHPQMRTK